MKFADYLSHYQILKIDCALSYCGPMVFCIVHTDLSVPLSEETGRACEIRSQEEPDFTEGTKVSRLYRATVQDIEFQRSANSELLQQLINKRRIRLVSR
jgi:hypothetical protein